MKELFTKLGVKIKDLTEQFYESALRNNEPLPSTYQLTINDILIRTNKIITFYNLKECMDFVNHHQLMYDRTKDTYLIQINPGATNHVVRLSSFKNNVHEEIQNFHAASAEC